MKPSDLKTEIARPSQTGLRSVWQWRPRFSEKGGIAMRTFVLRSESHASALWAFLRSNWRALAEQGKPLAVVVSPHKAKRSTEQNRRYWALLNEIAANAWVNGKQFSADAWHEFYKAQFIGKEETPDGREIGISTTTLDVAAFGEYMTRIEVHAAQELGIELSQ